MGYSRTAAEHAKKYPKRVCVNCNWFNFKNDDEKAGSGYCRRYPPVIEVSNSVSDGFPNVRLTDWCGEYNGPR